MNEQQNNTGWIVAGVLAIVIVILLVMMWQQWDRGEQNLGAVLEEGQENLVDARAAIAQKCSGPQGTASPGCQDALDNLRDILEEFSEDLDTASTTPTAQ